MASEIVQGDTRQRGHIYGHACHGGHTSWEILPDENGLVAVSYYCYESILYKITPKPEKHIEHGADFPPVIHVGPFTLALDSYDDSREIAYFKQVIDVS